MLLELKRQQLIDAQQLEDKADTMTAARNTGLETGSSWSVFSEFSSIASYASGFESEGQKGLPEAGSRFSQYSRLALARIQGLVCMFKPLPQLPCFSDAGGRNPLSGANSSAMALIW